jgi:hypothetical protein
MNAMNAHAGEVDECQALILWAADHGVPLVAA